MSSNSLRWTAYAAALWLAVVPAAGSAELDVPTPYVPSTELNVDEMLRLADVKPGDVVYDLGSGDGRVVIAAARDYGARGVGLELDVALVDDSRRAAQRAGVAARTEFRQADVLTASLRDATVVTMYLLPPLVRRLQDRLYEELRPGARIVAHDYPFPDWTADRRVQISKTFYLYTVPARVAGVWHLAGPGGRRYELALEQRYQEIKGAARVRGGILPAFDARLEGTRLRFVLMDGDDAYRYEGTVQGDRIAGRVRWGLGPQQRDAEWEARRDGR